MNELWRHLDEPGWTCTAAVSGPLSRADISRYAGASGDVNLVHVDEPFAVSAGHPSVLAHGMLTMGLTGSFIAALAGHHHVRSFGGRFMAPVAAGDALTCTASVRAVRDDDSGVTVEIDVRTTTHDGTEVFRGEAVAARHIKEK